MRKIYFSQKLKQFKVLSRRVQSLLKNTDYGTSSQLLKIRRKLINLIKDLKFVYSRNELKKILGAAAIVLGLSFTNQLSAQWFESPVENPFDLVTVPYNPHPAFADLDNDGDFDMIVGKYVYEYANYYESGRLQYFENTGTANDPMFAAPEENPFGLTSSYYYAMPAFADLDDDGDMDLLVSEYYDGVKYFENTGTASAPQFASPLQNPFSIELEQTTIATPITFADLDDDGDMDLFAGETGFVDYSFVSNILYFENTGSAIEPLFAAPVENPFGITTNGYLSTPSFADLDGDGDLDLIIGESSILDSSSSFAGNFQYLENTGTVSDPAYAASEANPFGIEPIVNFALPTFIDIDDDGDFDLMVGEYNGALQYFENINSEPLGIVELDQDENFILYPNPVNTILSIESDKEIDRIEIIDLLGRVSLTITKPPDQISISELKSGMYTVKVYFHDGKQAIKKVLKE